MFRIVTHTDPKAFLNPAEPWLMKSEAEYNLLLGLARNLTHSNHGYEEPIFLATVEKENEIVGCAFRTPPYKFGLTQMPLESIPYLIDRVQDLYETLPAVLGPEPVAREFAEIWCARKQLEIKDGMRQRIFQLSKVDFPKQAAAGVIIVADESYLELVTKWLTAFQISTGLQQVDAAEKAVQLIAGDRVFLWVENGIPKAMAGAIGGTENGIRLGYIFTPLENRGNGYATTLTAELSQQLLDAGRQFCFLYTDLSNPTSNSIYQKIGYRPVADVMDFFF